jgi:DNA-binding NarL/FixJ family response regulator
MNTSGQGSVLVVDDDAELCGLVERLLSPLASTVHAAHTASAAIAAARDERPTLVLLDVHLPDMSGYEVCRQLRDDFGDEMAIIFISGARTEEYDRAGGLLLGADDYIVKPFAAGELIARVRRFLDRSARRQTAQTPLTPRELEVLRLLAQGLRQDAIADRLFITSKTVATHIQNILEKLNVHSRAEAVAYAHRHGLASDA